MRPSPPRHPRHADVPRSPTGAPMSHSDLSARVPLRLPTATATFAIAIAGYLGVNLSPYMITALQTALGADLLTASWIVTGALLATAIVGLAAAPLCAGPRRLLVARAGL